MVNCEPDSLLLFSEYFDRVLFYCFLLLLLLLLVGLITHREAQLRNELSKAMINKGADNLQSTCSGKF